MRNLSDEIKHDAQYIKEHTLQPQWFKVLKVFILIGFITGYYFLFGGTAILIFCITFFPLMLIVHMVYRINTNKFTSSWLDFVVFEEDGVLKTKRIGKFYYGAIVVNLVVAILISLAFN